MIVEAGRFFGYFGKQRALKWAHARSRSHSNSLSLSLQLSLFGYGRVA